MNCALFSERLGGLLAGTLSPEEKARAEAHAAGCPRCGEVRARWGEAAGRRSADVPGDLAAGILSRTSGPPCERARARLGDLADGGGLGDLADGGAGIGTVERRGFPAGWSGVKRRRQGPVGGAGVCAVERRGFPAGWSGAERRRQGPVGGLGRVERQLVEAHLRHCPDCAALAAAVARLGDDLPTLASPSPPPEFAAAVLARTCRGPNPRTAARRRRPEAAGRLWARPRIAWEAGCVAALAIWLACGASWSPLRTTAVEARVLLQQGVSGAGRAGAESAASVNRAVAAVRERTVRVATQGAQDVAGQFALGWRRRAAAAAPQLDRHWRQFVQALEDRDVFDGVAALRSLSRDAGAMLAELLSPSSSDTAEDAGRRPAARSRP